MLIQTSDLTPKTLAKWAGSIIVPLVLYYLIPRSESLNDVMVAFLCVTLWAVLGWALDLMEGAVIGILLPVLYIVICKAPNKVVFSPWLSDVAIIVVGGFTLGKITQATGLGRRVALTCIRKMGGSFSGTLAGFTVGAAIVAPFVPSIMGKAAIFCAIAVSLCDAMDFKPKSREATAIVLGTCLAVGSTKLAYLTGAGDLVLGIGIVEKVTGIQTSWLEYALYNFVPAMLYTALSLCLVLVVLRCKVERKVLLDAAEAKYAELGPITVEQKRAAVLFVLTLVLLATDFLHHLSSGTVLILIMGLAFLPGVRLMDGRKLASINFAPLFFIMGCMAIGSTGGFLKVTQWLASIVLPLFNDLGVMASSLSAYGIGVGLNFLLTPLAATSTLTAPMCEVAVQMGMDPRVLFFALQFGLDNIIFPYEYALYLYFYGSGYINFKQMALVMILRILINAVFVSAVAVPFWRLILG